MEAIGQHDPLLELMGLLATHSGAPAVELTGLHACAIHFRQGGEEVMGQQASHGPDRAGLDARARLCLDVVHAAGVLALQGFENRTAPVLLKGHQDFLTETDGAVEILLRRAIGKAFPADAILGEEMGGNSGDAVWVIDPIDGTANFARGIPHYCVVIAFVAAGAVQFGTTFNPSTGELYFARRGHGATLNGKPIQVASTTDFNVASVELGWSTRVPDAEYLAKFGALLERGANVRRAGSGALGLAFVAAGRSDGYAELHMNPWDCLTGLLLVKEAGGRVGPFPSSDGLARGGPVIAAARGVAEIMSAAVGLPLEPCARD